MIAYFDTSAVVPLLVVERGSARAAVLWDGADRVVCGRLTARQLRVTVTEFDSSYEELDLVEVDDPLARHAGQLAEAHGLRGCDAVHLAAAHRVWDPDLVLVAGDEALLTAATAEGMSIAAVA